MYGNNKNNPFEDDFTDSLCKLNLNEISEESVKSFPMPNGNNNNAETKNNTGTQRHRRLLHASSSSTPIRPVSSFIISNVGLGRSNLAKKRVPSKWDDAEKWLMSPSSTTTTSTFFHNSSPPYVKLSLSDSKKSRSRKCDTFKQQQMEDRVTVNEERVPKPVPTFQRSASFDHYVNPFATFNGGVSPYSTNHMALKDKITDSIESMKPNLRYSEPTQEGFLFRNLSEEAVKDACKEVIPLLNSTTSRCNTPIKSTSSHNTPELLNLPNPNGTSSYNVEECHCSKGKLGTVYDLVTSNWSTSDDEEEGISKSLRHNSSQKAESECRKAATWEEEEKNKCYLRYQREEAKIQAWVSLQNAKAEAQSRKFEVKIQKMRSKMEEKMMKKISVVHRKAEEWRRIAKKHHLEQIQKTTEEAQNMIQKNNNAEFSRHISCGCLPYHNNYH